MELLTHDRSSWTLSQRRNLNTDKDEAERPGSCFHGELRCFGTEAPSLGKRSTFQQQVVDQGLRCGMKLTARKARS